MGGNHEVEVPLPVDERRLGFLLGLLAMSRGHEISKRLEGDFGLGRAFPLRTSFASYIKHSE